MNELFTKTPATALDKSSLGTTISSWVYKPAKSDKFWFAALGVIGALAVFVIYWGDKLLPWIKHIPSFLFYVAIFLLSPLIKYLSTMGKDEVWTLYEHGYSMAKQEKGSLQDERMGFWKDFSGCSYDSKGVKLIPAMPMRPGVRIRASFNVMEVYTIARDRISSAHAQMLNQSVQPPARPKTWEQRQLHRAEQKYRHTPQKRSGFWDQVTEGEK
jgi:hypothetical protein